MVSALTTAEMVQRYLDGATMTAIASAAGISKQAVEQRLRTAKRDGGIPHSLGAERNALATSARMKGSDQARSSLAQRRLAEGYTPEFRRLVGEAACRNGVLPTAREWGVAESSVRAWRNEMREAD